MKPGRCAAALKAVIAAALCALLQLAAAQTLDDVDVRTQADAVIVRLRLNAAVGFVQQRPLVAADEFSVWFEFFAGDDALLKQTAEEVRRVAAQGALPELTISYRPELSDRKRELRLRFAGPVALQARQGANSRSLEFVVRSDAVPPAPIAVAASAPAATASAPAADAAPPRFAVLLETLPLARKDEAQPIPAELQSLEVSSVEAMVGGVPSLQVLAGSFASRAEAETVRAIATTRFPQARVVDLAAAAATPPPPPAAAEGVPAPAVTPQDIEQLALELMTRYREERLQHHTEAMIAALNELLRLPPNRQTRAAQEAIGGVWEEAGEPARARAEYELYLKLYPQGEGATRVAQRLQALGGAAPPPASATAAAEPKAREAPPAFVGSIAQYYDGGKARTKSIVNIATGIDQATLSSTTESAIVTSVDLGARYAADGSETRVVVRGSGTTSLISERHGSSALSAAYVDWRRTPDGLAVRLGRQSPISGGLLGMFDGVSLAWPARSGLKLDLMGGMPANTLVSAPGERLLAAVVEADGLFDRWGGNLYLLQQTSEGITNRRALGAEVRYAGDSWSLNTLADYDTLFAAVNALSVHASVQAGNQTTVTMLLDQRRAPSLMMTNALISSGAASLKTLLQTKSIEQIKDDARATSATARQALVSMARPLDPKWQLAMDLRYSEIGALPAVGDFQATPATGDQYTATMQVTGTNLYSQRDVNNFNFSITSTPFFKGVQLAYNNLSAVGENGAYTLEPSLRVYAQRDQQDVQLVRVGPGLRTSYRASRRTSLLGELLYEASRTTGPVNHDNSQAVFFYIGYRYELY